MKLFPNAVLITRRTLYNYIDGKEEISRPTHPLGCVCIVIFRGFDSSAYRKVGNYQ